MIHVRVCQHHGGKLRRYERKGNPVERAQVLVALKQAAIDQNPMTVALNECFRAGHRTGCSEKCKVHDALPVNPALPFGGFADHHNPRRLDA